MNKKRLVFSLLVTLLFAVLVMVFFVGCDNKGTSLREVTHLQIKDTVIYLAPEGDAREAKVQAEVMPREAANQKIYYKLVDQSDAEYLGVTIDGSLYARKIKEDEYGVNIPIPVRLVSQDNPNASAIVNVIIERVAVSRIIFRDTRINLELQAEPMQLDPIFEPYHASIGRDLQYVSSNNRVATVTRDGVVTPIAPGVVNITAISRAEGSNVEIKQNILINVQYSPLNYKLALVNELVGDELKFVTGDTDEISFSVQRLDNTCDPTPKITWSLGGTRIEGRGIQDNPSLTYRPGQLSPGVYSITVKLESGSSQMQILESMPINVYYPLEALSIDPRNDGDYTTSDVIRIGASYKNQTYPPESYKWKIVTPNGLEEVYRLSAGMSPIVADLEYAFEEAGDYTFTAEAIVKGAPSGVVSQELTRTVVTASHGTDVYGLTIEGKKDGSRIIPYVYWDAVPYKTSYEVEVIKALPDGRSATYNYDSQKDAGLFSKNSIVLRETDVTLADSFEVRVRGSRYNWSNRVSYQGGTITPLVSSYLEELTPTINSYISSMEDLGRFMNYITIFRPEELKVEGENNKFQFDLYIPFSYSSLPRNVYSIGAAGTPSTEDPAKVNLYYLIAASMGTYAESTSYSLTYGDTQVVGGKNKFTLKFSTSPIPTTTRNITTRQEANVYTNYALTPREESDALPIDVLPPFEVSTSNQLVWAALNGYRPAPVAGSAAADMYAIARKILKSINASGMNDREKIIAIYDWLSYNVGYDNELLALSQSPSGYDPTASSFFLEGVFRAIFAGTGEDREISQILRGIAVCDGISKAFSLLASMEGINNYRIVGQTTDNPPVSHAWNNVMIGGRWYVVDATWGSEVVESAKPSDNNRKFEFLSHKYAFLGSEESMQDRIPFGVYPSLEEDSATFAYNISTCATEPYDLLIDSKQELLHYLSVYLPSKIGEYPDVWGDVCLSDTYLSDLYNNRWLPSGGTGTYENFVSLKQYNIYINEAKDEAKALLSNMEFGIKFVDKVLYIQLYTTN
jgi:hypothetical protein